MAVPPVLCAICCANSFPDAQWTHDSGHQSIDGVLVWTATTTDPINPSHLTTDDSSRSEENSRARPSQQQPQPSQSIIAVLLLLLLLLLVMLPVTTTFLWIGRSHSHTKAATAAAPAAAGMAAAAAEALHNRPSWFPPSVGGRLHTPTTKAVQTVVTAMAASAAASSLADRLTSVTVAAAPVRSPKLLSGLSL
jgi:hypothetical protein